VCASQCLDWFLSARASVDGMRPVFNCVLLVYYGIIPRNVVLRSVLRWDNTVADLSHNDAIHIRKRISINVIVDNQSYFLLTPKEHLRVDKMPHQQLLKNRISHDNVGQSVLDINPKILLCLKDKIMEAEINREAIASGKMPFSRAGFDSLKSLCRHLGTAKDAVANNTYHRNMKSSEKKPAARRAVSKMLLFRLHSHLSLLPNSALTYVAMRYTSLWHGWGCVRVCSRS